MGPKAECLLSGGWFVESDAALSVSKIAIYNVRVEQRFYFPDNQFFKRPSQP